MAKQKLIDQVRQAMPKKGQPPWYTLVSPDLLAELKEVVESFKAGELKGSKTGLAYALSKSLEARGVTIGVRGVQSWLERN